MALCVPPFVYLPDLPSGIATEPRADVAIGTYFTGTVGKQVRKVIDPSVITSLNGYSAAAVAASPKKTGINYPKKQQINADGTKLLIDHIGGVDGTGAFGSADKYALYDADTNAVIRLLTPYSEWHWSKLVANRMYQIRFGAS